MVVGGQRLALTESAACYSTPRTRRRSRTSRGRTAAVGARAFATAAQCPAGCVATITASAAAASLSTTHGLAMYWHGMHKIPTRSTYGIIGTQAFGDG